MTKTISFVEEDSEQLGHLIVNHKFVQFEITEESGKVIKKFQGHKDWLFCIEQIEDFTQIIACSNNDITTEICSTESGECLKTLTGHTQWVQCLIISNNKKYLISGSEDVTIRVWNIENDFECVQTLRQEYGVFSLCLLPNNILACGLGEGLIAKWNLNNFTKIDSFEAHENGIRDLKHLSSSQIASCSEDKQIKLWDLETNECLRTLIGHTDYVSCLEISFDKPKLYSVSEDGILRVWDISSGECLRTINLRSVTECIKLLSSNFIAVGLYDATQSLKIIDLKSHEIFKSLETDSRSVTSLNFDLENNVLYSASGYGEFQMWQF
jgi:WD40 repeat protein